MTRRIVTGIILAALLTAAFLGYRSWNARRSLNSGEVFEDAGDSSPYTETPSSRTPSQPQAAGATSDSAISARSAALHPPPGDSISSDSSNGSRLTGPGRFEVYRQGNLTFRIDTVTGTTCILFATRAEWSNPEVYNQGCNTQK